MFDCAIIGGGIAGLQAAIQLGRYMHRIIVIDREGGRSTLAKRYMNVLGWPEGISGQELLTKGFEQARSYGVEFISTNVEKAVKGDNEFTLQLHNGQALSAKRLLLSTGVDDRFPNIEGLKETLGTSFYVCPDCDGYEIRNLSTVVVGSGNNGAAVSCILHYWTKGIIYINHDPDQRLSEKWINNCREKSIPILDGPVKKIIKKDENTLDYLELANGKIVEARKGFVAFPNKQPMNELARQLGVSIDESGSVLVDGRTQQTNVEGVWAAGDLALHSQLVTRAMGDGGQAAIWIHKSLL